MKNHNSPSRCLSTASGLRLPSNRRGVALVIVLAFIVLLTGVVVAFFSRAVNTRQMANSSANRVDVDLFAEGAIDTILSDLKQEIVLNSTPTTITTGTVQTTIYTPKTAADAMPQRVGKTTSLHPNLLKQCADQKPFYTGATVRALALSSTTQSLNGRFVSPARWNAPLLLTKLTGTSASDFTPLNTGSNGFLPPDWVLVARDGSNPLTWNAKLRDASMNNTSFVVGRYAYNIYHEGGLLDMNAAGYPAKDSSGNPVVTGSQAAYKEGGLPFADLKQIPGIADLAAARQDEVISAIAAWRNTVALKATAGDPWYKVTFPTTSGTGYVNFVRTTTAGFLSTTPGVLNGSNTTGFSDKLFTTRQELIQMLTQGLTSDTEPTGQMDRANLQNALQYLTHFSRDLNQPSFAPGPSRPKIVAIAAGGNDASGGDDVINPSFLKIRVASGFTRNDGITQAMQGEPLVKKRFPLNYLAWLSYEGPSSSASTAKTALLNAGISQAIINQGTPQNILKYFGLTWSSGKWIYRSGASSPIKTLSAVTDRDPDFFELLKASINVGSIGKAYTVGSAAGTTPEGYNQQRDNSIDAQLMQMAANIIDQFDPDGYPTRIVFNDGILFNAKDLEYRGVEDLPYLYRVREGKVMTRDSNPSQAVLPQVGGTIADEGEGVVLLEPEIWNPHVMMKPTTTSARPTSFRLVAATLDPITNTPTSYKLGAQWRPDAETNPTWTPASATPLNATMTFGIPTNRLDLFREPTLLIKPGIPTGSGLTGPATYTLPATTFTAAYQLAANNVTDNRQYTGIPMGKVPMAFSWTFAVGGINRTSDPVVPPPPNPANGIAPTGYVSYPATGHSGDPNDTRTSFPYVTYRLQCQDSSGQWITYDEKFAVAPTAQSFDDAARWPGGYSPYSYNKTFYALGSDGRARGVIGSEAAVACFDPRTSRFGMGVCGSNGRSGNSLNMPLTSAVRYWGDDRTPWNRFGWAAAPAAATNSTMQSAAAQMAVMTFRPDEYQGGVFSNSSTANNNGYKTGPTAVGWSPIGVNEIISPGLLTQNNSEASGSTLRFPNDQQVPNNSLPQYFADADNVVRRAMSAFVPAGGGIPAAAPADGQPSGLPLKPAYQYSNTGNATASSTNDHLSRPVVLNRPFRSIAELGYVFSGTPWRNLDCATPESGAAALLDVFCVNDTQDVDGVVAGKVNLNTRQAPVLQAILAGAYKDELDPTGSTIGPLMSATLANSISTALVARTSPAATAPQGPLMNISELVGKWYSSVPAGGSVNGSKSYVGFSSDTVSTKNDLTSVLTSDVEKRLQRYRESAIRALAGAGQTRVWNVMIDVVAQTGRYPQTATALDKFVVEGEQRYWVHLAIDRFTGKVIDKQTEVVKE